jgi:hypothetical protein
LAATMLIGGRLNDVPDLFAPETRGRLEAVRLRLSHLFSRASNTTSADLGGSRSDNNPHCRVCFADKSVGKGGDGRFYPLALVNSDNAVDRF